MGRRWVIAAQIRPRIASQRAWIRSRRGNDSDSRMASGPPSQIMYWGLKVLFATIVAQISAIWARTMACVRAAIVSGSFALGRRWWGRPIPPSAINQPRATASRTLPTSIQSATESQKLTPGPKISQALYCESSV